MVVVVCQAMSMTIVAGVVVVEVKAGALNIPGKEVGVTEFSDHFSGHSQEYGQFRPVYPEELFFHLSHEARQHNCAWDCATGTGQAAVYLAKYFKQVFATDASENQINQTTQNKNIHYSVAQAENSGLEANSIDLITVASMLIN